MPIDIILTLIETIFQLWLSKEKTKYIDRVGEIKRAYYEEWNKGRGQRSNAVLDNLEFELRIAAEELAASARIPVT